MRKQGKKIKNSIYKKLLKLNKKTRKKIDHLFVGVEIIYRE